MKLHTFRGALLLAGLVTGVAAQAEASPGASPRDGGTGLLNVPESYHEAMNSGGHLRHVGFYRPDAGARVACRDCHDLDRDGFDNTQLTVCKTCHEDQSGFHHGPPDGGTQLPDGGTLSCLTCHPFAVIDGKKPLTPWLCMDCHAAPIGGAVAVRAHEAACFYCHQPHRTPFTQPTECTVCHEQTLAHGAQKGKSVVESCMTCHDRHTMAAEATKHCVSCHADPKEQKNKRTVVTDRALFKGHDSCGSCHIPHRFAKSDVKTCVSCHDDQPVLARTFLAGFKSNAKKANGHARCLDCHELHGSKSAQPKTCESCHKDIKNNHPPPKDEVTKKADPQHTCMQCHPIHVALPGKTYVKDCASCHKEAEFAGEVHGKDTKTGKPLTCDQCHKAHAFVSKKGDTAGCKECHQATFTSATKMKKAGHAKCDECHSGLPHKPGEVKKCLDCHEKSTTAQKGHTSEKVLCTTCHDIHSSAKLKTCTQCHDKPAERPGLHLVKEHDKCETCHAPHGAQPFTKRVTCQNSKCHETLADHEPKAVRCTACHLFGPAKPGDTPAELKKKK